MIEKDIVAKILKGEEKALREFYQSYCPKLSCFVKGKIADEKDAEEVLQDIFLAFLESLRDFSFRSSLYTFIYSIAQHKIIDYYRRKRIKNIVFSKLPELGELVSTLSLPEEELDSELLCQKINGTFRRLAPKYEKILKLKYIYGYSVLEIAQKMSISFKSAESSLFRARRAFIEAYSL
jgi:RNA polymerase sigma-70 factor (ECF subfamily)